MEVGLGNNPERLLELAKSGHTVAFGLLLEQYRSYLLLLLRVQIGRRLQGKLDAEDLLQEVSLMAHRAIPRLRARTEGEFLAWLRQILAAVLANEVRKYFGTQQRNPQLERELIGELDHSSHALDAALVAQQTTPSQQAARREQAVLLAQALDRLPPAYREVIVLRQLEDLTFPEVAQRMGRTENSVKNLWARALGQLRNLIADDSGLAPS